ncbi:hypothetical protein [Methylococcus sp. EFPC2]|uniref:hypothetical protein n=1 Tax=Methylococcus sp. EFPC2 TaxID=2812648 RepID=UPI001967BEE4|nr:hypothetical protein [Methylococcus sp. EFPC2]QSA98684.1 hypothetical protein JWZ97_07815 [Methylococcus sp. EFPC2]
MKNSRRFLPAILPALALVFGLTGCGGDGDQAGKPVQGAKAEKSSHTVSASEHQAFEKKYAEKCVRSQQKDAESTFTNDQELGRVCECMAKEISARISKADATHFLEKNEFPFDLVMMTNAAVNTCDTGKKK